MYKLMSDVKTASEVKLAAMLGNPVGGRPTKASPIKIDSTANMSKTLNNEVATGVTAKNLGVELPKATTQMTTLNATSSQNPFTQFPMAQLPT